MRTSGGAAYVKRRYYYCSINIPNNKLVGLLFIPKYSPIKRLRLRDKDADMDL
jgi:hypothetical protein